MNDVNTNAVAALSSLSLIAMQSGRGNGVSVGPQLQPRVTAQIRGQTTGIKQGHSGSVLCTWALQLLPPHLQGLILRHCGPGACRLGSCS